MAVNLLEDIADMASDAVKDKIADKAGDQKVKERIKSYLQRKQRENEGDPIGETLDFVELDHCFSDTLFRAVKDYLFASGEDREGLRRSIINKAVSAARASDKDGRERVENMVSDMLDIARGFYRENKNQEGPRLLAGQLEELVANCAQSTAEVVHKTGEETKKALDDAAEHILMGVKNCSAEETERLRELVDSHIEEQKEKVMNQLLFPWFRDGVKYKEVFPKVFIEPVLTERDRKIGFDDLTAYGKENITILGVAGAGKSTLLRYVFSFSLFPDRKCIYLTAKEALSEYNALDKIIRLASLHSEEPYLVLIDGLDEAFAYDVGGLMEFISKLRAAVKVRFWLGCRSDYYERNFNETFSFVSHSFTISPWTPEQANAFIERYSSVRENPRIRERADELLGSDEKVIQIKSNPFQLSLLVFLAENDEKEPVRGIYDLYERFLQRWIDRERKRGTSKADSRTTIDALREAANQIYNGGNYIVDESVEENSAVRDLLIVSDSHDIYNTRYAAAFCHRSVAAFLLAQHIIEAFLSNDVGQIRTLLGHKLKDDVTNFVGNKFSSMAEGEKERIKHNLVELYRAALDSELSVKEQIIYFVTRLGIDVTDFMEELVDSAPQHPIMRLTIAYGCVLSENPKVRAFALDYARSISQGTVDAVTNRAWTVIYFGDVADRDPYTYADDEQSPWDHARKARIKRFTRKTPRLKDYRFRLFDIPLFRSFLEDRGWNDVTPEEYNILRGTVFPEDVFRPEEKTFLEEEKAKLLRGYKEHLKGEADAI